MKIILNAAPNAFPVGVPCCNNNENNCQTGHTT